MSYPTKINLFHYSIGLSFERKKNNIIAGMNYMRGKNNSMKQFINFTEADDVKYMVGPVDNSAVATMNSFSLVIGYLYRIK